MFTVEHVAWQAQDPVAVADWYVKNLGFRVLRRSDDAARAHFMADASGRCVLEIYNNPVAPVLEYATLHPLQLHLAFSVEDVHFARETMLTLGCTIEEDLRTSPAGDHLLMMRDPFGFPIQFVKRAKPMV